MTFLLWYPWLAFAFAWAVVMVASQRYGTDHWGVLVRWRSLWVGAHYSSYNRRWCINLIPCVTLWVTLDGGTAPCRR